MGDTMSTAISRRDLLISLPALVAASRAFGQTAKPSIRIAGLNHVALAVSDVKRSVDFYQGLFGMPVQSRQGGNVNLRIGAGPQFLGIIAAGAEGPDINHLCLGVPGLAADRVTATLAAHGVTSTDEPGNAGGGGIGAAPMRVRVRTRAPEAPGRPGTTEVYFRDPDGIVVQLQDATYCGGGGALGDVCPAPEASPKQGLLALHGWSHCTIFVADAARSNDFYRDLFGLKVLGYQGPTVPAWGLGGVEFLMFAGGIGGRGRANAAPRPASINHLCMNMDNFDPEAAVKALESYGIKPRPQGPPGPTPPLVHYTSMRMPNRGGAPGGTPELYFTDPDGLLIQVQDTKYCGGAGLLGDVCSA